MGCTLCWLASKCACNSVKQAMAALLAPHQLGFGILLGAEAAVHATRVYLQDMPDHHLLLKLDFRNAFNSLRQDKMLLAVCEKAPQLFPWFIQLTAHHLPCSSKTKPSCQRRGSSRVTLWAPCCFPSQLWISWSR